LKLDKGKYKLVLNTLYNTNIRDEFKQDFEVGISSKNTLLTMFTGGLIILFLIVLLARRKKKKKV